MHDLTPKAMRCGPFNCPSVYQLEDGRLQIVGMSAIHSSVLACLNVGPGEETIIIDQALLDDYVRLRAAELGWKAP
jgi:hypothetical protein